MEGPASEPIAAPVVVLAAGASTRVGRPKGLVDVHEQPWLMRQLERLAECHAPAAVVVLGHAWDAYARALPWVLGAHDGWLHVAGVTTRVARNDAPERGPFSSLQCGIAALEPGSAAFVLPIDVPVPGRAVWRALARGIGERAAAVPTHGSRGGHPVLCSAPFLASLAKLAPEHAGARLDVQLHAAAALRIEVDDPRVVANMNTLADFAKLA